MFPLESLSSFLYEVVFLFFWWAYITISGLICQYFFVLELSLYFFGFIFRNELPDNVIITIQYICNTWYIASIYITLSLLVLELIRLSQRIKPWFPKWMKGHWQQTKLTLFFLIVFGVTGLMIHAYHTVMNPIVKNVYITLPKAAGDRDSLTIVMMSDLHIGEVIGKDLVQKYVALQQKGKERVHQKCADDLSGPVCLSWSS